MSVSKGKVIIVGGGLSGLTAGVYLRKFGFDVEILEKNHYVGGLCTGWTRKGSLIDGCIHWLTGSNFGDIHDVMVEIGALNDEVQIHHFDTYLQTRVNGKDIKFYLDCDKLQNELLRFAKGKDEQLIRRLIKYIKSCRRELLNPKKPYWSMNAWDKIKFVFRIFPMLGVMKNGSRISLQDFADSFESEELRFFFNNTILPREYSMLSFCYTMGGICSRNSGVPHGGSKAFAERIADSFKQHGGVLSQGVAVKRVLVDGDKATGVELMDGSVKNADFIVSACDVHFALKSLFEDKYKVKMWEDAKSDDQNYEPFSIFLLSFRTSKDMSNFPVHSFFECEEYDVLGQKEHSLYMKHFGYDDSFKHEGQTLVQFVFETRNQVFDRLKQMSTDEYKRFKADFTQEISHLIGKYCDGVFGELEFLDLATPLTLTNWTNAYRGSFMAYKLGKNNRQFSLRNDVLPLKNVALAGNWLMIPGGVPIAIQQGKFAAQTIDYEYKHLNEFDAEKAKEKLNIPLKSVKKG